METDTDQKQGIRERRWIQLFPSKQSRSLSAPVVKREWQVSPADNGKKAVLLLDQSVLRDTKYKVLGLEGIEDPSKNAGKKSDDNKGESWR